ncbi:MAG: aminotransferase class V-fold PLP-dependent enzyme [Pseudomonadota bacterium]
MIDAQILARIRAETPGLNSESTHLLACGSALPAQPVLDTVIEFLQLEAIMGGYEAAAARSDQLNAVYGSVARHINADPQEIALVENATVAWCQAFYALPMEPGQRILTCESEYASNYLAFLQRAKRDGVKIEVVPSDASGAMDPAALDAAIGPDVAVVAVTWVPTSGGLVNPAAQIGNITRKHGVPYLLDACQAVGQLRVDVREIGCDFLSATGRKFLRGPRGTGFLYVAADWASRLEPPVIDLHSASWVGRDSYTLREDARRFENWENAYALHAGLGAALDYADKLGIDAIEARVKGLADHARDALSALPGVDVQDLGTERAGIVSFTTPREAAVVAQNLAQKGFIVGTSSRTSTRLDFERRDLPTLVRIAPHYYNTEDELDACVDALATCLKENT